MSPRALIPEGRGVQAGVQYPPWTRVGAANLRREADAGTGVVAQH